MFVEVLVLPNHEVDLQLVEPQKALAAGPLADRDDEGELVDQLEGFFVGLEAEEAGKLDVEQKVVVLGVQLAAKRFLVAR